MNEEQRNKQVIQELDGMMLDLYSDVVFDPNVERNTYYPVALQIAKHITAKEYKEFRLTYEANSYGTCVSIYYERVLQEGGFFSSTKYAPKQCIGVLVCDIEKNRVILRKTNVNTECQLSFAAATREYIEAGKDQQGKGYDPRKLLAPGADAIKATVKEKMELFGSVGKA